MIIRSHGPPDETFAYLNGSEDCNYEQLAVIIRDSITGNISDKTAAPHIDVWAAEDGDKISLTFSIEYSKKTLMTFFRHEERGTEARLRVPVRNRFQPQYEYSYRFGYRE